MTPSALTISELLVSLAEHSHQVMRSVAACNPALPTALVEQLAHDPITHVRMSAASNPACPEPTLLEVLEAARASDDREDRFRAVSNPRCPPSILLEMASSDDGLVRSRVASHPDTPPEALASLLADPDGYVRETAARHARVPLSIVDAPLDAREAAAWSDRAPPEVLIALAADDADSVHAKVARNPHAPHEALLLIDERRERLIQLIVLENPNCPTSIHRKHGANPDRYEYALAGCPNGDPDVFRRLLAVPHVRDKLAANPSCPSDVLEQLASGSSLVKQALAANPSTPTAVLHTLARSKTLKHFVAKNPSCPRDLLEKLAKSEDVVVLRGVAANPNPPVAQMARMVAAGVSILLEHPDCPDEAFEVPAEESTHRWRLAKHARNAQQIAQLAEDADPHVRQAAARNPMCPVDVLLALFIDRNEHVADAAANALAQLDESQSHRLRGPVTIPEMPEHEVADLPPLPESSPIDPELRNCLCTFDNETEVLEALGWDSDEAFIELYVAPLDAAQDLAQATTIDGTMLEVLLEDVAERLTDGSLQIAGVLIGEYVTAEDIAEELQEDPETSAFFGVATMYEYTTVMVCDSEGELFLVFPDLVKPLGMRWEQLQLSVRAP